MASQINAETELTALNLALGISAPVSSVPGSASFFLLQPLLTGKLFGAAGVLLGAQIFLILAKYIFGLNTVPLADPANPARRITMPIGELQALLGTIAANTSDPLQTPAYSQAFAGGGEVLAHPTGENPVVASIILFAHYSSEPFAPTTWLIIPILTFPGLRGTLPILILEILSTIFVRAVVPPQTTGAKPLTPETPPVLPRLNLAPSELLKLLERFSPYFK